LTVGTANLRIDVYDFRASRHLFDRCDLETEDRAPLARLEYHARDGAQGGEVSEPGCGEELVEQRAFPRARAPCDQDRGDCRGSNAPGAPTY
jgi:hypothetical protein